MFTGLVGCVTRTTSSTTNGRRGVLEVEAQPYLIEGLSLGASVAVNGVCLTSVASSSPHIVAFDTVGATIDVTTIPDLRPGDLVNIERSLALGDELGGHDVSGHVDATAVVRRVSEHGEVAHLDIGNLSSGIEYTFPKGYVAVDGVSLTIADRNPRGFAVWLIPETRRATRFCDVHVGDRVNLEFHKGVQVVVDSRSVAELARGDSPSPSRLERRAIAALIQRSDATPLPALDEAKETP